MRGWVLLATSVMFLFLVRVAFAQDNTVYLPVIVDPQEPSPTPTPTPVPTSIPTPTPAPLPLSPGVYLLDNHAVYPGSVPYVVGEIFNGTNDYIENIIIRADFYENGQWVGTFDGIVRMRILPPNTKTCFVLLADGLLGLIPHEYELTLVSYDQTDRQPAWLEVVSLVARFDPTMPELLILSGEVRNPGDSEIELGSVTGTLYDAAGTVVDCREGGINSDPLSPGEQGTFELDFFFVGDYRIVESYRVQAYEFLFLVP